MLIFNPAAGQRTLRHSLIQALLRLELRDWDIDWRETRWPGDATRLAYQAVEKGYDVVLVAGGDGTIGQVVTGLAGSKTALGILPVGTGNVVARDLGLPYPNTRRWDVLLPAVDVIISGNQRRVDVGVVYSPNALRSPTHFLAWTGTGFDAHVTRAVEAHPQLKRRLAWGAFVILALRSLRYFHSARAVITIDGERIDDEILLVVASNIGLYAGLFQIAPAARLDDGLLDVYCFHGTGIATMLHHALNIVLGRQQRHPRVSVRRARHITIHTDRPFPFQIDGDFGGYTPLTIEILPRALTLYLPAQVPRERFTED